MSDVCQRELFRSLVERYGIVEFGVRVALLSGVDGDDVLSRGLWVLRKMMWMYGVCVTANEGVCLEEDVRDKEGILFP